MNTDSHKIYQLYVESKQIPELIQHSGWKEYVIHGGIRHREDGPAFVDDITGRQVWYKHGTLHRDDGPAILSKGGNQWFINGNKLTEEEFNDRGGYPNFWEMWQESDKMFDDDFLEGI